MEMEAACASLTEPGDRVLVIDNGIFGRGFADFVSMYQGLPRDIILRWQASGFEMSVTMLAAACSTSTSYVSRVITLFRAILSSQMGA